MVIDRADSRRYKIAAVQPQLGTFEDTWLAVGAGMMFAAFLLSRLARARTQSIGILALLLLLWGGYAVYEWRMQMWSRAVIAPIRIDLALIVPVLIVVSARAWTSIRTQHRAA